MISSIDPEELKRNGRLIKKRYAERGCCREPNRDEGRCFNDISRVPPPPIGINITGAQADNFFSKFARFAWVHMWSLGESKYQLCWSLTVKASEYYAMAIEKDGQTFFYDIVQKLKNDEMAQILFNNAKQSQDESLENWANRIQSLAAMAY